MIIVMMTSGLGNQMYQYSMYRMLSLTYPGTVIKADITRFRLFNEHQGFELKRIFEYPGSAFHLETAGNYEIWKTGGGIPIWSGSKVMKKLERYRVWYNRRADKLGRKLGCYRIIEEDVLRGYCRYDENIFQKLTHLDVSKDWNVRGYWEDERYYRHILPQLQKDFTFPPMTDRKNRDMAEKIKQTSSVSIHVRRGDYIGSQFDILSMDYYKSAVKWIRDNTDGAFFFLFSDDKEYAKEAFSWLREKEIVCHNQGQDSFRDMELMSLCKHNIVANSTFSTWAGLLNRNPGRRVVYPERFTKNGGRRERGLEGWVALPVAAPQEL